MHIPASPTQTLDIPSFADALDSYRRQIDAPYDIEKWLYIPHTYTDYRYILGTKGPDPLICVGINPSTAAPDKLDNTLKSVERIAAGNGFSSWLMFNVYAQRATRPDDMDTQLNERLHRENMEAFAWVLAGCTHTPTVWAAWGAILEKRDYLPYCVRDMIETGRRYAARWVSAGSVSRRGHPHHPLYLKKDSPIEPFDIEGYAGQIKKSGLRRK